MDLESENSALESTGDNGLACSTNPSIEDDINIESNGVHDDSYDLNSNGNGYPLPSMDRLKLKEDADKLNSNEQETVKLQPESASLHSNRSTSGEYVDAFTVANSVAGKGAENDQPLGEFPLSPPMVPLGSPGMSPPATGTKGKGLRKWRRIRREVSKDCTANPDVTKILKRGSPFETSAEMKQKSEGSVLSAYALIDNPSGADAFSIAGSSSVYTVVGGSTFSVGADSDNSKDRSIKSSTAAFVPKSRHDPYRASGHSREKYRMKHTGGKHLSNASQMLQQGAGSVDTSKKPRGGVVQMDKENSFSSLESDSRSYSSVFMQGSSSAINNGHSERSGGYDGEHSYDVPAGEQQSVEGPPSGPSRSVTENEEISQNDAALSRQNRRKSKNNQHLGNGNPLVDCVQMLQSAQEALEQEIKKFGELGKDIRPLDESIKAAGLPNYSESVSPEVCGDSSFNWPTPENAARDVPHPLEAKLASRAQNTELLEKQLEEAMGMLKEKESRISELEATINDMKSSSEDLGRVEAEQNKYKEIETEMEGLFKQKTEAEIKYLAIADKSIIAERQMKLLLAKQKSLVSTQAQVLRKIDHLESKVAMLKDNDEEGLSTSRGYSGPEIQKMKKKVAKFSSCFFIQLILFSFVLQFFTSRLLPKSAVVMPT